jgi:hypothetical protein
MATVKIPEAALVALITKAVDVVTNVAKKLAEDKKERTEDSCVFTVPAGGTLEITITF